MAICEPYFYCGDAVVMLSRTKLRNFSEVARVRQHPVFSSLENQQKPASDLLEAMQITHVRSFDIF